MSLAGCAREPVSAPPEVIKLTPPLSLLSETPHPDFSGSSNGDLINYLDEVGNALDVCNADKASVRNWVEKQLSAPPE